MNCFHILHVTSCMFSTVVISDGVAVTIANYFSFNYHIRFYFKVCFHIKCTR